MLTALTLIFSWLPAKLEFLVIASIIIFVVWSVVKLVGAVMDAIPWF